MQGFFFVKLERFADFSCVRIETEQAERLAAKLTEQLLRSAKGLSKRHSPHSFACASTLSATAKGRIWKK
jgi:hypothetical protein